MRFSFYTIDTSYCNFLRQFDAKVPHTLDKKSSRPFVGIIFSIMDFKYYAPLTSPKPKHLKMSNQIDFLKINNLNLTLTKTTNLVDKYVNLDN